MDPIELDQQAENLRQRNNRLMHALQTVDMDIDRAAAKYLNSTVPHGKLQFRDFLELLALEIRRSERALFKDSTRAEKVISKEIQRLMEKKLDEQVSKLLPTIQGKLADYLTIEVLILPKRLKFDPTGKEITTPFQAFPLRWFGKRGKGDTAELAYADLREQFVIDLFARGQQDVAVALVAKDRELAKRYAGAEPFRSEVLEGFRIEARAIPEKGLEKK